MKNIINTAYILPVLFFVLVAVFSFNFIGQDAATAPAFEVPTAEAFGGSGGPGGNGGSGGGGGTDSGCGGCGEGANSGSNNGPDGNGGGRIKTFGCKDINATNYNPGATDANNSLCTYPEVEITKCELTLAGGISSTTIENGGSVTMAWDTEGFENITINGQPVSGASGNRTFNNIIVSTTYTLVATNSNNDNRCTATVIVNCLPPVVEECKLEIQKSVNKTNAKVGEDVTYTIDVKNVGNGDCTGGGVKIYDVVDANLTYKSHVLTSNITAGYGNQPVYSGSDRTLRFNGNTLTPNESGTITWTGTVGNPTQCGDFVVKNIAKATAKELDNFGTWVYSQEVQTNIDNECVVDTPLPRCDNFNASPTSFNFGGGDTTLTWETTDATNVSISGIGNVALDNTTGRVVSVPNTRTFVLTATNSEGEDKSCVQKVTVQPKVEKPLPRCDNFNASPTSFNFGGGDTTLTWETTDATNVSISGIGNVALDNTTGRVVSVPNTRTFVLTATNSEGEDKSCVQKVTVGDPEPVFNCAQNVNFSVSDTSIRRGDSVTLNWSTVNVDSLTISNTNDTALAGNRSVSPSSDTTYTLRATQGDKTINCPVSVDVSSGGGGGGGGGTRTPRCDLDISDKSISKGEEITLRWDTSYAKEITIKDDRGDTIFTTDDFLSKDKKKYLDGSIKVKPTRDTEYTLNAESGSRDKECNVKVKVKDSIVVLEDRDQQPLVTGISLTQVPYTGFEAGPFMTSLFYALLVAWSLFITYLLVIRNRVSAVAVKMTTPSAHTTTNASSMKQAESLRPDVFAPSVMSKVSASQATPISASQATPTNLPTGISVAGQDVIRTQDTSVQGTDATVTALENQAHAQKALLSSDAVRHFIATTEDSSQREEALNSVISEAKSNYPLEDGWIVINQARMQSLCQACVVSPQASVSTVPAGAGSLAEAIVTGNVVAAYEMIGNRPMFALADAAADLDAVYRNRKGESNSVSDLLSTETSNLSEEQLTQMIAALTGALDGTYTDEASAVKMSIMKAVKVAA